MKSIKLLIVVTLQLVSFCASRSAKTESLVSATVPFQLISPTEFNAIFELSNGNPFVTQNRLLNSGSQVITNIINNIVNGLISPVNITGLDPIYNSIAKPTSSKTSQGYPFCAIQTNRNAQPSQRSYDAIVDPASNFGTFSINFYQAGTVNIDNYDEDIAIDEVEPPNYHSQKPSQAESNVKPSSGIATPIMATMANYGGLVDANKDKPDNSIAPVINCIVVLKEPSQPATPPPTTTPAPTPTPTTTATPTTTQRPSNRPSVRPSFYPQYPGILTPHHPQDPNYSIGPYQVVPIPYPPFLGLIGPASAGTSNWPTWPGSQAFASNNPSSTITPTWPYWSLASPPPPSLSSSPVASLHHHQGNKNPQTAPTWPYLAIPSQSASTHVPTTSSYLPSSFWTSAINHPDAGNPAPSPTISIHSNPAAWFRPPAGALFNPNHLIQQQQQNYNENDDDEIRSAAMHDEIAPENQENQVQTLIGDEHFVGAIQRSQKEQSRRMGLK